MSHGNKVSSHPEIRYSKSRDSTLAGVFSAVLQRLSSHIELLYERCDVPDNTGVASSAWLRAGLHSLVCVAGKIWPACGQHEIQYSEHGMSHVQ